MMPQLKKNFEPIKKIRKKLKKNSSKSSYCEPLGKKRSFFYTSSYWTAVVKPENIT